MHGAVSQGVFRPSTKMSRRLTETFFESLTLMAMRPVCGMRRKTPNPMAATPATASPTHRPVWRGG